MECTVTRQEYINYILFSLTLSEPCTPDYLNETVIDQYWDMYQMFAGCSAELNYLLARRESLRLLMFCTARQVDNRRSDSRSAATTTASSRSDGNSQRQSTHASSGRTDSVFKQRYNDFNNASSHSFTTLLSTTRAHDRAAAHMDDTGSGFSRSDSSLSHFLRGFGYSNGLDVETDITRNREQGAGCVFDFSSSDSKTIGDTDSQGDTASLFGSSGGIAAVTGWSVSGGRSVSSHFQTDYTWSTMDRDAYKMARANSQAHSSEQTSSQRNSIDYFHALRDEQSNSQTQSNFEAVGKGVRDSRSHAEGQGTSQQQAKGKESGASQATSKAHDDSEAKRDSNATSSTVSDYVAAGQRFKHLQMLLANTEDNIEHLRSILKGQQKATFGLLDMCDPDGYCSWAYKAKALPMTVARRPVYLVVEVRESEKCQQPHVYVGAQGSTSSSRSSCLCYSLTQ